MGLVTENAGTPATHALIIGVNDYPHLAGGVNADAAVLTALKQLTSPVPSATLFANWLLDNTNRLIAPLGTVRVLLSGGSLVRSDGSNVKVDLPTTANIKRHFDDWYASCNSNKNCIALFYFCGHGFMSDSSYIMPEDVCSSGLRPWENCIDFSTTHLGMAKCRAETQCFFIDACQDLSREALLSTQPFGQPLLSPDKGFTSTRDAPVYRSAASGQRAKGQLGLPSDFTTGLVECLSRFGASANDGRNPWRVTTSSLRMALGEYLDRRRQNQAPVFASNLDSTTPGTKRICTIAKPQVFTNLELNNPAVVVSSCVFTSRNTGVARDILPPYRDVFDVGNYDVSVGHDSPPPWDLTDEYLAPPVYPISVPQL